MTPYLKKPSVRVFWWPRIRRPSDHSLGYELRSQRLRFALSKRVNRNQATCSRMIRSQVPQRTTPWTAGIFHDADKKAPCSSSSLRGTPSEGMLIKPSDLCSLKRIT